MAVRPISAANLRRARDERAERLYVRYLAVMRAAGRPMRRVARLTGVGKLALMRTVLRDCPPPAWRWENMLEACDIGLVEDHAEAQLGGRLGQPTKARPGSEAKLDVLIARAAAGVELWHPDDVTLL